MRNLSCTVKKTKNRAFTVLLVDEEKNTYTRIWDEQGYELGDFAYIAKPAGVKDTYKLYKIRITDKWYFDNGRFLVDHLHNIAAKFKGVEK